MEQQRNGGLTIGLAAASLMIDQAQGILNQAREALRDHPRATGPITALWLAQIAYVGTSQTFVAMAPTYGLSAAEANRLTELAVPTAQQRQRAEQFEREVQQHA